MKIEEVRPSFTVYLIASEVSRLEGISDSLGLAGYMVASFTELTAAISEVYSNPPHFLLFDAMEAKFSLKKAIKQVNVQLPESHIYLVTPANERETAVPMLDQGVYDLILTPLASQTELVRKLDRAAERDYFMYMNERLSEAAQNNVQSPVRAEKDIVTDPSINFSEDFHLIYASQLFAQKSPEGAVEVYLKNVSAALGSCSVLYLKYIANRRVLVASLGEHLKGFDISGLGVDFNAVGGEFRASQLRDPQSIPEVRALAKEVFGAEDYFALPIEALNEVQGIAVFLRPDPSPGLSQMVHEWTTLLGRALSLQESEKRLHVMAIKDPATNLLNRANFLLKMRDEISRARRTNLPVSLALITLDQYGKIVSEVGQEEAQTVLKMAARIFEKHSRVNDVIGRTSADEFGIILAHTHKQGAMIKAERLRKIIESADFSRVVKSFPNITISLGLAEYPSMAHDAEELIQTAEEALFQVRKLGNKTCVAKPPENFVADFEVNVKGT
jgi:diguanylate cyclase (GGDEF)-like protein